MDVLSPKHWHPLIGSRLTSDAFEWRAHVDTKVVPELDDHRIEDQALLPGAGIIEMAWAAAREWLGTERAFVTDLEILQPMTFAEDALARGADPRLPGLRSARRFSAGRGLRAPAGSFMRRRKSSSRPRNATTSRCANARAESASRRRAPTSSRPIPD